MKRLNRKPIDKRKFDCPQCEKPRLIRPIDHVVSKDKCNYKDRNGDTVELYIDICDFCQIRNFKKFFAPIKSNFKKLMKQDIDSDQSLENLL